ncbi:MAG: hypothetical protein ACMUJI_01285 [Erythrobacter sp.]|uniref:hypothetical protein n=1 Tax=Erythrobacter sp. TaxID=1042 RepID=UPI003A84B985
MSATRIDQAMARIGSAMERIDAARARIEASKGEAAASPGSSRVMELVNAHERLREEVADTIGELDALIEELEQ